MQTKARASDPSVTALGAADTAAIMLTPALTEEQPDLTFSDSVYDCRTASLACFREHERALMTVTAGIVQRTDKRLMVAVSGGNPLIFIDWKMPGTKVADGDEESHWYLGRLPGNG